MFIILDANTTPITTTTEDPAAKELRLTTAVADGDLATVRTLIEGGADVDTEDGLGRTLLLVASL